MVKTCKSHGVAIHSGERVSNVSLTYPPDRDSCPKGQVIPDEIILSHDKILKGSNSLEERAISYQLVGEVTAHQGDDA